MINYPNYEQLIKRSAATKIDQANPRNLLLLIVKRHLIRLSQMKP